jgi:hypothetical protein
MGRIVRLTESDLTRLVKRVIREGENDAALEKMWGNYIRAALNGDGHYLYGVYPYGNDLDFEIGTGPSGSGYKITYNCSTKRYTSPTQFNGGANWANHPEGGKQVLPDLSRTITLRDGTTTTGLKVLNAYCPPPVGINKP